MLDIWVESLGPLLNVPSTYYIVEQVARNFKLDEMLDPNDGLNSYIRYSKIFWMQTTSHSKGSNRKAKLFFLVQLPKSGQYIPNRELIDKIRLKFDILKKMCHLFSQFTHLHGKSEIQNFQRQKAMPFFVQNFLICSSGWPSG